MPTLTFADAPEYNPSKPPRSWLPEPAQLVQSCGDAIADGQPEGLWELAPGFAAPPVDLTVTPLTARSTVLAAEHGRAFYHHELRRRIAMPSGLEPEVSVWEGGTVPAWSDGVLAEPKYFSFFQDAPIPAYNPNHRRKWRAHELLHGASRFFWHPQMTRFEFYVSARLNELLPVVHWYHLDEVFRPRCAEHEDTVLHRDHCLDCQKAAVPYWESTAPDEQRRVDAAEALVDRGWNHFEEEWEAITAEIETGRRVETPRPRLDASSDAVGYMRAHWNRVTAWSFGRWVETFLKDGVDYFSSLEALRHNVGDATHRLVGGTLEVSTEEYLARRTRSQLQDLGYRVLLALEWLDPESEDGRRAEEALMPVVDDSARVASRLLDEPEAIEEGLDQFARTCQVFSEVAPRFPEDVADGFLAFGYRFIDPHVFAGAGVGQVFSGLEDGCPAAIDECSEPVETVRSFILAKTFDEHGRLAGRFARWLDDADNDEVAATPRVRQLARFEAFANAEPRSDREATHFAALPERAGKLRERSGVLRAHKTLRRDCFPADILSELTGQTLDQSGTVDIAASLVDGDFRMVVEDELTSEVLDRVTAGEPIDQWWDFRLADAIMELLEFSLITWLPAPRP